MLLLSNWFCKCAQKVILLDGLHVNLIRVRPSYINEVLIFILFKKDFFVSCDAGRSKVESFKRVLVVPTVFPRSPDLSYSVPISPGVAD